MTYITIAGPDLNRDGRLIAIKAFANTKSLERGIKCGEMSRSLICLSVEVNNNTSCYLTLP